MHALHSKQVVIYIYRCTCLHMSLYCPYEYTIAIQNYIIVKEYRLYRQTLYLVVNTVLFIIMYLSIIFHVALRTPFLLLHFVHHFGLFRFVGLSSINIIISAAA